MHGNNNANSEKREKEGKKRIGNRYTRGFPFICNILFFKKKKKLNKYGKTLVLYIDRQWKNRFLYYSLHLPLL